MIIIGMYIAIAIGYYINGLMNKYSTPFALYRAIFWPIDLTIYTIFMIKTLWALYDKDMSVFSSVGKKQETRLDLKKRGRL